jgi:hypothetical protein
VGSHWGSLIACYTAGPVHGTNIVGGLAGENWSSLPNSISNCFWDTSASGQIQGVSDGYFNGGIGKTTAEMMRPETFTDSDWDFVGESENGMADIWRMCTYNVDYPRLSWEFSRDGDFDCPDGAALDDLLFLAARWLIVSLDIAIPADATLDGKVDLSDLAVLAKNWIE